MPGTIQSFFATIDPVSPPPQQLRDSALRRNRSHQDETFKLKLLRWRRRVLPPGLPAVHSKFQRHRLATTGPYAGSMAKDRPPSNGHEGVTLVKGIFDRWAPVTRIHLRQFVAGVGGTRGRAALDPLIYP